jgi:hypothetical protein
MSDELDRIWKEVLVSSSRYSHGICLEKIRKCTESLNEDTECPAEIRTKRLPNTSEELYCYASTPFCDSVVVAATEWLPEAFVDA